MGAENLVLCVLTAIILDITALVLVLSAYMEKRDNKKIWGKISGDMELVEPGASYPLENDEILIGRHGAVDIQLPDMSVSRYHAMLTVSNGVWAIQDLNSKSGVYVNGNRVKKSRLRENDTIQIGNYRLMMRKRRDKNAHR